MSDRHAPAWWLAGAAALALRAAVAAEPLPPVTAADRAAAFPDVSATDMGAHMHSDPLRALFKAEELEWQGRHGDDALHWDVSGWIGYEDNRLWLRDEGEKVSGDTAENRLELLWTRPLSSWWDWQAGARLDTGPGPSRTYAALGVQGLLPQWLHLEATAYLGEGGQLGARLQGDYDWLLSNRFILTARLEAEAWGEDDPEAGLGSGLSEVTAGLRLRYEIRRKLAPYVGVEWSGLTGDTADLARAAGEERRDTRWVAGLRFWF